MELGLYHKPIINFQGVQIEGVKSVKLCRSFNIQQKMLENSTPATTYSHMSSIFQLILLFFQPHNFLGPRTTLDFPRTFKSHSFQGFVLTFSLLSSVKDENFQSTSVFYKAILKISFEYYSTYKLHFMRRILFKCCWLNLGLSLFDVTSQDFVCCTLQTLSRFIETLSPLTSCDPYFAGVTVLNNFLKS